MHKSILRLMLAGLFAAGAWAQDPPDGAEPAEPGEPAAREESDAQSDARDDDDGAPLEDQAESEVEDVFIPTEEIPVDEEVTFPVDI